jgi:hypothetical protein
MKRVIGMAVATLLSMGLMAGVAAADTTTTTTTCSIYETGSASYNSCTTDSTQTARVTCDNNVYVLDNNSQNAGTGGVTVTNNTTSGNAVSGSALNSDNNTVTIGTSCGTVAATPTTTTTTPGTGGDTTTPTTTTTTPAVTPQVVAPVGAVHAGGGGTSHNSSLTIAGLIASAGTVGVGAVLLRKRVLGL